MNGLIGGSPAASLQDAHTALEECRKLLLDPTPRNIDVCCSLLSRAGAGIGALQEVLRTSGSASGSLCTSAAMLRIELDAVARLLQTAAVFHANVFQCMQEASGAPASSAVPAPVRHIRLSA